MSAISKRMQFNHWHYIPGHFDQAQLNVDRHFYYPPGILSEKTPAKRAVEPIDYSKIGKDGE